MVRVDKNQISELAVTESGRMLAKSLLCNAKDVSGFIQRNKVTYRKGINCIRLFFAYKIMYFLGFVKIYRNVSAISTFRVLNMRDQNAPKHLTGKTNTSNY
ncbi:hypothetical protein RW64_19735 [Geobacter sulfurreducens]|nr:hypothetical protein RW64_19735 [Geobacter sulfurreducens]